MVQRVPIILAHDAYYLKRSPELQCTNVHQIIQLYDKSYILFFNMGSLKIAEIHQYKTIALLWFPTWDIVHVVIAVNGKVCQKSNFCNAFLRLPCLNPLPSNSTKWHQTNFVSVAQPHGTPHKVGLGVHILIKCRAFYNVLCMNSQWLY